MKAWITIAALALTAAARPAPPLLEPNGPWVVEAEENLCVLTRAYGADARKVVIGLQPMFNMERMEVIVLTQDPSRQQRTGTAKLTVAPAGAAIEGEYFSVGMKDARRYSRLTVDAKLMNNLPGATELAIDARPVAARVHLVRIDAALKAFNKCQTDLLTSWGVDPAVMAPDHAPKAIRPSYAFSSDDYPLQALRSGVYGRAVALLQVGADGLPTRCRVVASAGKLLDDATCARAMKVRFKPGTDAAGRAMPGAYLLPVRWVLPGMEY